MPRRRRWPVKVLRIAGRRSRTFGADPGERRIGGVARPAGGGALVGKHRGVAARPAIGSQQNFVGGAFDAAASGVAIRSQHPDGTARWRSDHAGRALRAGGPGRSGRSRRTGIALGTCWSGRSGISFAALRSLRSGWARLALTPGRESVARRDAKRQREQNRKPECNHAGVLEQASERTRRLRNKSSSPARQ